MGLNGRRTFITACRVLGYGNGWSPMRPSSQTSRWHHERADVRRGMGDVRRQRDAQCVQLQEMVATTNMKQKTPKRENPKAKAAQLELEWKQMMAKHSKPLEGGAKAKGIKVIARKPPKTEAPIQDRIPSNPKGMMGLATKSTPMKYTGDKIIGIATMHKSNMVPIFNEEAAVDVAQMRRN